MGNNAINNEQAICESLSEGDVTAFTAVYNQYYAELYFLSKRIVGDNAADIVADVFAEIWNRKKLFASVVHLQAYLRAMTRNACFDLLKKQRKSGHLHFELWNMNDQEHEDHYFEAVIEANLFSLINQEIEQLPPHIRQVFKLSYIEGLSNGDIARLLNMKDASVRVRKAEALQLLRNSLYDIELMFIFSLSHIFVEKIFYFFP